MGGAGEAEKRDDAETHFEFAVIVWLLMKGFCGEILVWS